MADATAICCSHYSRHLSPQLSSGSETHLSSMNVQLILAQSAPIGYVHFLLLTNRSNWINLCFRKVLVWF